MDVLVEKDNVGLKLQAVDAAGLPVDLVAGAYKSVVRYRFGKSALVTKTSDAGQIVHSGNEATYDFGVNEVVGGTVLVYEWMIIDAAGNDLTQMQPIKVETRKRLA